MATLGRWGGMRRWAHSCTGILVALMAAVFAEARPPATRLLPDKTVVYAGVRNVPDLSRRFMNTSLGRMSDDPQVRPLVKYLYGSVADLVAKFQDRIDLGLNDLLSLPQGELAVAVVAPDEQPPALVVLLDVGDQLPAALRFLQRSGESLEKAGIHRSEQFVSGTKFTTFEGIGPRGQRAATWFEKDATIVLGTNVETLQQILASWSSPEGRTLAENQKFAAIVERCRDGKGEEPQVVWYVDPMGVLRGVGQRNAGVQFVIALLPTLGLDGVSAAGGSLMLDAGQFDSIMHAHLLLESPRSGVVEIVALEPGDTRPERWVPGDVATYITVNWNVQRSYKTLTKLFDSFRGEGAFAREVQRRFEPIGSDFANEILPCLGNRLTYASRIDRPATVTGPGIFLAVRLKDPAAMTKILEKAYERNKEGMTIGASGEHRYYQGRMPPPRPGSDESPPTPCLGVLDEYLLFANRPDVYLKAIATRDNPSEGLAEALDYKLVASRISRLGRGPKPALARFDRPDEGIRFFYDLVQSERGRQQLRKQAERDPVARTLYTALEAHPLPPFSTLQKYFAPSGAMLVDDETGLHYTAFSLRRKR